MVNALKSVLRNPLYGLLFRFLLWFTTLVWLKISGVGILGYLFLLLLFSWIYYTTRANQHSLVISFLSLLFLSYLALLYLQGVNFFIAALLSGVALFILSAVNDLLFL